MKKQKSIVTAVLFCGYLAFFGALSVILPDKDISYSERRRLESFPKLTVQTYTDGAFMKNLEKYLPDQFPWRDGFRGIKAVFERLSLRTDSSGIYEYKGSLASLDFDYSEASVIKTAEKLKTVRDEFLSEGHRAYISLIPPKNYCMREGSVPVSDYEGQRDSLVYELDGFEYVDIYPYLSLEDYYKTDSHWRQERLIDIAHHLTAKMGADSNYKDDGYQIHEAEGFRGVYAGQSALPMKSESIYYLTDEAIDTAQVRYIASAVKENTVYTLSEADGIDMYSIFLGGAVPVVEIMNPKAETDKSLTVFRDSYGSSLIPLLIRSYSRITAVDLRYISTEYLNRYADLEDSDFLFIYNTSIINTPEMLRIVSISGNKTNGNALS